jgi:hypothetical protein
MDKLDLTKAYRKYYTAANRPQLEEFEAAAYLMIQGQDSPDSSLFTQSTEALYKLAYGIKFLCKAQKNDFTVAKLEGLWWFDSPHQSVHEVPREEWNWKLLIRMPDFVDDKLVEQARVTVASKVNNLEQINQVKFEVLHEGTCVQMLHVGPYNTEPETIEKILAFMESDQLVQHGLHHEIYISDPRKVNPAVMKTILRLPVRKMLVP